MTEEAVKGPIAVDDVFTITGRGHVFTASPGSIPDPGVNVGDVVRLTANSAAVAEHEYFDIDSTYKIRGIEVVRTLMYPPSIKAYGFLVSKVEEDPRD